MRNDLQRLKTSYNEQGATWVNCTEQFLIILIMLYSLSTIYLVKKIYFNGNMHKILLLSWCNKFPETHKRETLIWKTKLLFYKEPKQTGILWNKENSFNSTVWLWVFKGVYNSENSYSFGILWFFFKTKIWTKSLQ